MEEEKLAEKSSKSDNKTTEKGIAGKDNENQVPAEEQNSSPEIIQKESTHNVDEEQEDDEKEREEIDIYLFSNGQTYSPPRKYHLGAVDLSQWKATLGYLARKHYGSLHSALELYELDGRKVEDSKYLRDCAVYVAVVPPDLFIYAGYDKYLIKASKSFERRLSKKANDVPEESSNSDIHSYNAKHSKLSQDVTPAPIFVKHDELRAQHQNVRNRLEVRRLVQKNVNSKIADKLKPVANQVSQRPNFPRKLNLKSDSVAKKTASNKKEYPSRSPIKTTTPGIPGNDSLLDYSTDKGKTPHLPELYTCDHSSHKVNESLSDLADNKNIINTYVSTGNGRRISKPICKNNKPKGETLLETNTCIDLKSKRRLDSPKSPNGPRFKAHKPVLKNILKQSIDNLDTNAKLLMANKDKVLEIKNKASSKVKIKEFPSTSLRTNPTNTSASMVDTSTITISKEYTEKNAVYTNENDVEDFQTVHSSSLKLDVTKYTNKDSNPGSTVFNGENLTIAETPKLHDKQIILIDNKTANYKNINLIGQLENKTLDKNEPSTDEENADNLSHYTSRTHTETISKIKPIPESRHFEKILENGTKKITTNDKLLKHDNKLHVRDDETKSISYDLKVPILHPAPETPKKYVYNTAGTKQSTSKYEIVSDGSNDQTVNADGTKVRSYTIIIKKDDVKNTITATAVKTISKESQKSIQVPINNMVKNEDLVLIEVHGNSVDKTIPIEYIAAIPPHNEKQINKTQYTDTTEESGATVKDISKNRAGAESPGKVSLKDADIKTTFMNPKWEGNRDDPPLRSSLEPAIQFAHKGDTVSLKLSMDTRNADGILKSNQRINIVNSNNQRIPIENSNNTHSDIDKDDSSKSPNELTQSKSFQSIEDDTPHLCCRKDKVVVYQCACCNRSGAETSNNFTAKPLFAGQGFYFLLPVAMPAQDSTRAPYQTCDKQVQHTESLIRTNLNLSNKETLISVPGDGDKPTTVRLSNTSENIRCEKFIVDIPSKVGKREEVEPSRVIMMTSEPSQTSSRCNLECKQQQTAPITEDQFTQTNWADVLLEARAEQDGHYMFYLPPLQVLQKYTFR